MKLMLFFPRLPCHHDAMNTPKSAHPEDSALLYRRVARHYLDAIHSGALAAGDRYPSIRALMARHEISLATALQACRYLENEGWLEARPRSGNFVRHPTRRSLPPLGEPCTATAPDPASYVGINARVSEYIALCRQTPVSINLASARGAPELYPADTLARLAQRILRRQPALFGSAGPHNGVFALRAALARRAVARGVILAPDEVVVTHGGVEALNLALRAVTQPGDVVAVESPCFYGLLQILETLGLRALEIPTSPQTGISLEALQLAAAGPDPIRALVVVPHLQNPLGCSMPDSHKATLVAWCNAEGIALIEDDSYGPLCVGSTLPRALKSWDATGNVLHCASLHKVLAPGLRLGWINGGRWHARVAMLKHAHTHFNEQLSQMVAAEFLDSNACDRHWRKLRQTLGNHRIRTADAIARHFPEGSALNAPDAGLMLWVSLPTGVSTSTLFRLALAEGILFAPGAMFSNSQRFDRFLRIGCGLPFTPAVETAIRRLGELANGLLR